MGKSDKKAPETIHSTNFKVSTTPQIEHQVQHVSTKHKVPDKKRESHSLFYRTQNI